MHHSQVGIRRLATLAISLTLVTILTACQTSPQVMAEQRMFLPISLEFLGEYQLPKTRFEDTPVGGLSALTYDRQHNLFYALSDDRSQSAPARFYTLKVELNAEDKIQEVKIEAVTFLTDENGKTYPQGKIDPEGMVISPRETVFISSEGVSNEEIAPFIKEFNLETGKLLNRLRIPPRYLPNKSEGKGIQDNLGFEALTIPPNGLAPGDPFRLFTATESTMLQDANIDAPEAQARIRLMHYVINPIGEPILVAEHLYLLEPGLEDTLYNGLTELTALEKEGYFLSLERTFGFAGAGAKIFQLVIGSATDTSRIASLKGNLETVEPLKKKLLVDLNQLGINLDNLEGMTFGPRLQDGSKSLILISDDNFRDDQVTQFLLFRVVEK